VVGGGADPRVVGAQGLAEAVAGGVEVAVLVGGVRLGQPVAGGFVGVAGLVGELAE